MADLDAWSDLAVREGGLVVAATARADGSIQSSVVTAGVMAHPVTGARAVVYVANGAVKIANMRARPWSTLTARAGWSWVTAEGDVELVGHHDALPGVDDVAAVLRAVFRAAGGEHDDWDEFDRVMRSERRAGVLLTPTRVYGV